MATHNANWKVLITTVPFGDPDRTPLDLLDQAGIRYVINPIGRRLRPEEVVKLLPEYDAVIAGTETIPRAAIEAARSLRLIARVGIGLDSVDLVAARERGVAVSYTPDAPSQAVAELAVGLMIDLLRGISAGDRDIRDGIWKRKLGRRLAECTVGLVGLGRIGRKVASHLAGGFPGVHLLGNDLQPDAVWGATAGVEWVEKDRLFREADIVSLHLPLTPHTRDLITAREIACMKTDVLLINTSRGGMIREIDLKTALKDGRIGGAAIDVFHDEPYAGALAEESRCVLTPHMGSMSVDSRARMEIEATQEVLRMFAGAPLRSPVPEEEYALKVIV